MEIYASKSSLSLFPKPRAFGCQRTGTRRVYSLLTLTMFCILLCKMHTPRQAQQGQRAVNCGTAAHNDSTCQDWSACMKLHRVQWPPGVSSQLWQMARTWQWISGLWGCLTYHSSCRHQHSHWLRLRAPPLPSFSPTCSYYVPARSISRNFKPKWKAFFFWNLKAKRCNFHPANV